VQDDPGVRAADLLLQTQHAPQHQRSSAATNAESAPAA
jgi:hypothetical protein